MYRIRAFTLIESLLTLFVVSGVLLLFSSNFTKIIHIAKGELFVLQFEQIYKDTQYDAGLENQSKILSVNDGQIFYKNKNISIPDEVKFDDFSIKFDSKAGNSSLQKIKIYLPYEEKTITYQLELGSGKYKKKIN